MLVLCLMLEHVLNAVPLQYKHFAAEEKHPPTYAPTQQSRILLAGLQVASGRTIISLSCNH